MVGIILLGLIAGYLFYSNFIAPNKEPIKLPNVIVNDTLSKFRDIKSFNFGIFDNLAFKSLKILGDVPVQPGSTGRANPFEPF